MGVHDTTVQTLAKCKSMVEKLGDAVPAKDRADLIKRVEALIADTKKVIPLAAKQHAANEHAAVLLKAHQDYVDKMPDETPIIKLVQKINTDAETASDISKKLSDAVKKKDPKSAKVLNDMTQSIWDLFRETGSVIIFIGDS